MRCRTVFRGLIALSALAALPACQNGSVVGPETEVSAESHTIKIAAWNIEHLADENGEGCRARTDADYALVRNYIRHIDADIWVLQEIENIAALERVFDGDWTMYVDQRPLPGGDWPPCYGDPNLTLGMQRTAIVVRDGINHRRLPDLTQLDVDRLDRLRPGVRIELDDAAQTQIVSLHLKSGCNTGDTRDACPTLFSQLVELEDWIDAQSQDGRPVILAGDFNRRMERDGDQFWLDLNDGDPSSLHIAGAGTGPRCNPRYSDFIDFFVLNNAANDQLITGSFDESTFRESEGNQPSDHCPITIEVNQG